MKRITLYGDELDGEDILYADHVPLSYSGSFRTKYEQQEHLDMLRMQRKEYEERNGVFLFDERKKFWMK